MKVTNTGELEGAETIFVFLTPPSTLDSNEPASKMNKRLVDWEKQNLGKGNSFIYEFSLEESDLVLYDVNGTAVIYDGIYTLTFTNGVDQVLTSKVTVSQKRSLKNVSPLPILTSRHH